MINSNRLDDQLVEQLGLSQDLQLLKSKQFHLVSFGERDLEIRNLLGAIKSQTRLSIPRTCHLGDWQKMAEGGAGALDFNQMICDGEYGFASVYGFTQTEAVSNDEPRGDWVYRPGSHVVNGQNTTLPLYTWNGSTFQLRDRSQSYFCPFVKTEVGGVLLPLSSFHMSKMEKVRKVELEAEIIIENWSRISDMLQELIVSARGKANTRQALHDLVGHSVDLDGRVSRSEIQLDGDRIQMNDLAFQSMKDFVNACRLPFLALTSPDEFFANLSAAPSHFPRRVPVLSNLLVSIFTAIFQNHLDKEFRISNLGSYALHLHWGARDMAGYPPFRKGYYKQKSTQKSLRQICEGLSGKFPEVKPLMFVLMPAAIFMLNPPMKNAGDRRLMQIIFEQIKASRIGNENPDLQLLRIQKLADEWLNGETAQFSEYFVSRFRRSDVLKDSVPNSGGLSEIMTTFLHLTVREACILTGILSESFTSCESDVL